MPQVFQTLALCFEVLVELPLVELHLSKPWSPEDGKLQSWHILI